MPLNDRGSPPLMWTMCCQGAGQAWAGSCPHKQLLTISSSMREMHTKRATPMYINTLSQCPSSQESGPVQLESKLCLLSCVCCMCICVCLPTYSSFLPSVFPSFFSFLLSFQKALSGKVARIQMLVRDDDFSFHLFVRLESGEACEHTVAIKRKSYAEISQYCVFGC